MPARVGRPPQLQVPETPLTAEPVAKSVFARIIGCDKSRVTAWCNGPLVPPAVTEAGKIVPSLAVEMLVAAGALLPRPGEAAAVPPTVQRTYDQARAAHESLKVDLAELDLAERRGELVPKALADHVMFSFTRAIRDAWVNWPARPAAVMAARLKVDPALLLAELDRAVKVQLHEVADPKADWRALAEASYRAGS